MGQWRGHSSSKGVAPSFFVKSANSLQMGVMKALTYNSMRCQNPITISSKLPFIETQRYLLSPLRLNHEVVVRLVAIKLAKEGIAKVLHAQELEFSRQIRKVFWMHLCHC